MTTALDPANDPYMLPLPTPDTPVVLPQWISRGNTHHNARYRDMVWPLAPLIDNPSTSLSKILWRNCPPPLREQMRLPVWTMINGRLRPTYLKSRGPRARPRTSPTDMQDSCWEWMRLARWLHLRSLTLADCTEETWRNYISTR